MGYDATARLAALAAALERMYRDPALRKRLGAAGRHQVICEFDLLTNAAALAERFHLSLDRIHEGYEGHEKKKIIVLCSA